MRNADATPSREYDRSPRHAPLTVAQPCGPVALLISPHAGRFARGEISGEPVHHTAHSEAEITAAKETTHQALAQAGIEAACSALTIEVGQPGFAARQIALWRERRCVAVVAAGGDGTVGAAATLAMQAGLPLGILPLGTSNDVARSLGIPMDVALAAQIIARGKAVPSDVGQVIPTGALALNEQLRLGEGDELANEQTDVRRRLFWSKLRQRIVHFERRERHALRNWLKHTNKHGAVVAEGTTKGGEVNAPPSDQKYFLHALTLGLNVEFARLATSAERRRQWGALTYAASAMEALQHARSIRLILRLQGYQGYSVGKQWAPPGRGKTHVIDCHALQLAIINQPVFGGALRFNVPGADGSDGLLDFLLVEAPDPGSLRATLDHLLTRLGRWAGRLPLVGRQGGKGALHEEEAERAAFAELADAHGELIAPGISRFRAHAVVIETPDEPTPLDVTLDGEVCAHTPVFTRVASAPLHIFAPDTPDTAGTPDTPGATEATAAHE